MLAGPAKTSFRKGPPFLGPLGSVSGPWGGAVVTFEPRETEINELRTSMMFNVLRRAGGRWMDNPSHRADPSLTHTV